MIELELRDNNSKGIITMDNTNYTIEHRKGQHLLSEEWHEIQVRLKDGWSIYQIAKHLGRPYNTMKNEVKRGTVLLYNGKQNGIRRIPLSAKRMRVNLVF